MALMRGCAVADRSDDRGGHWRADAGDLSEPLAGWIGRDDLFDLFVHRNDLLQILPLAPQQGSVPVARSRRRFARAFPSD